MPSENVLLRIRQLSLVLVWLVGGCTSRERDLAYDPSATDAGVTAIAGYPVSVLAFVVDARPLGGASLSGGTTGGGTLAEAIGRKAVFVVDTAAALSDAIRGDEPRVVLLEAGDYDLSVPPYAISTCSVACPSGSSLKNEQTLSSFCASGSVMTDRTTVTGQLAIGSNKTLIGLAAGANLLHASIDLSRSHNVILRNIGVAEVQPGLSASSVAFRLGASHHVWLDHCAASGGSHSLVLVVSDFDDKSPLYPLTSQASHITLSFTDFDGRNADACAGGVTWTLGTLRSPALTLHRNWIHGSVTGAYLFGPETWAHAFNNVIEGNVGSSVGVSCGGAGLLEANFFQSTASVLRIGDEGASNWPFCSPGLFGRGFAPMNDAADPGDNELNPSATVDLGGHAIDGGTLALPSGSKANESISVPLVTGPESYSYSLEAPTSDWAATLRAQVGLGKLF
ncbi:MAG: hypothetical protein QM756_13855 [Polyangiaceae bacterium]